MKCKINRHLLPIKAHYFLFWGGLSGTMPYLHLIGQGLGISATAAALLSSFYPLVPLIAKPLVGTLADHFKQLKSIIVITLALVIVFVLAILLIPAITSVAMIPYSVLLCSRQGFEIGMPLETSDVCASELMSRATLNTTGLCYSCDKPDLFVAQDYSNISSGDLNCSGNAIKTWFQLDRVSNSTSSNLWFPIKDLSFDNDSLYCEDLGFFSCHLDFGFESKNSCGTKDKSWIYNTSPFWLFVIFFVFSRTGMSVATSLSDTVCFEMLEGQFHLFGKQRMWGAIGWGTFSILSGFLLTLTPHNDFSPSLYLTIALLIVDAFVINKASFQMPQVSGRILKDMKQLLQNLRVLIFLCNVFCMGFLSGVVWNFFFWFLFDIKATKMLLSFVLVVQCFLGELPSFFFSGKLIEKIGFENAFTVSFLAFGVRFLAYSFITLPWYVLPVELLQGLTFGIFYSAMAMYAKSVALPGTEASMQGLVGGTFEGLGVAVGGLVAGVTFDLVGGHLMFRYASFVAFTCAFLHSCLHLLFNHFLKDSYKKMLQYNEIPEAT